MDQCLGCRCLGTDNFHSLEKQVMNVKLRLVPRQKISCIRYSFNQSVTLNHRLCNNHQLKGHKVSVFSDYMDVHSTYAYGKF